MRLLLPFFIASSIVYVAFGQPGMPVAPQGAAATSRVLKKKPVSVSYEAATNCFPLLEDERISFRVDLRLLKETIDNAYTTGTSRLMMRLLHFREGSGILRRVTLSDLSGMGVKQLFTPHWETLTDSGTVENWDAPPLKKTPVTMGEINSVVGRGVIERDETVYLDTKLNGFKLTSRKDLTKFLELRLEEPGKRTLRCEDKKDFGAICTCVKK